MAQRLMDLGFQDLLGFRFCLCCRLQSSVVIKDLGEERHQQLGTWGFGACICNTGFEVVCDFKVFGKA